MTRSISFINLKGGVGKTTLTVAVSEILALEYNKKVLVIDLDPQTNATVLLISQEEWKKRNENNNTIYQLFRDKVKKESAFDINKSIINKVSNIKGGIDNLDLLPSSIDLIDITDKIASLNKDNGIIEILKDELEKKDLNGITISDKYDYILIDCPPNLDAITMSGVFISKYFIIPVLPDMLSTYGLKQVTKKIVTKAREIKRLDVNYSINPLGVIINRYRNTKGYNRIKNILEVSSSKNTIPKLFETTLNNKSNYCDTCDYDESKNTLRQKYGQEFEDLNKFVKEIIERCDFFEK